MADPKPTCAKCGQVHTGCNGHRRKSDPPQPCRKTPGPGAVVCDLHGGKSPQAMAKQKQRLFEVETRKSVGAILAKYEEEGEQQELPLEERLLQVVELTSTMVRLYGNLLSQLRVEAGTLGDKTGNWKDLGDQPLITLGGPSGMVMHPVERSLLEWQREYRTAIKTCLDAGIERRMVQAKETQANFWVMVLQSVVLRLGVGEEQLAMLPLILSEEIRNRQAIEA